MNLVSSLMGELTIYIIMLHHARINYKQESSIDMLVNYYAWNLISAIQKLCSPRRCAQRFRYLDLSCDVAELGKTNSIRDAKLVSCVLQVSTTLTATVCALCVVLSAVCCVLCVRVVSVCRMRSAQILVRYWWCYGCMRCTWRHHDTSNAFTLNVHKTAHNWHSTLWTWSQASWAS